MNPTLNDPLDPKFAEALLESARQARENAYSPYSGFSVGAALLDASGRVHRGANVENAAYGLTTCAERVAAVRAVADGCTALRAIAIVGPEEDVACVPCGSCRQILFELGPDLIVVMVGEGGGVRQVALRSLLPEPFTATHLKSVTDPNA